MTIKVSSICISTKGLNAPPGCKRIHHGGWRILGNGGRSGNGWILWKWEHYYSLPSMYSDKFISLSADDTEIPSSQFQKPPTYRSKQTDTSHKKGDTNQKRKKQKPKVQM